MGSLPVRRLQMLCNLNLLRINSARQESGVGCPARSRQKVTNSSKPNYRVMGGMVMKFILNLH
jgi:hypothetical protein